MLSSPGKWSPITEISRTAGAGRNPDLAMNSSGYAVAVWRDWDQSSSPATIKASTLQFGNTWSSPIVIGQGRKRRFL